MLNLTACTFKPPVQVINKTRNKFITHTTPTEEYSYDYDGSAIPIKKVNKAFQYRVKILNPIYKVVQKDILDLKKIRTSNYNYLQNNKS